MKIAVIGANGNLGGRVTRQALDRGHEVTAIIYAGETPDERAQVVRKSLFDLSVSEMEDMDVIISAFGGGFKADPAINLQAFRKYIELADHSGRHLIAIGGAGSLYCDSTHTVYEYENPNHPDFLREISRNIKLGIDELMKTDEMNWTVVCPSREFDAEGPHTGKYEVGTEGEILFNQEGKSYVTYDDLAQAMVDIAEKNDYQKQRITVLTQK